MGRRRKHNKFLPVRMLMRRGAFYYNARGKWLPLGKDYGEALRQWAVLEGERTPKGRTVAERHYRAAPVKVRPLSRTAMRKNAGQRGGNTAE